MHIGICSSDTQLLEQQSAAVEDFIETSCLDLTLRTFCQHTDLLSALTGQPFDVLFYDTRFDTDPENQIWEVKRIIPNCSLVLLGNDTRHAVFGYAVKAADFLLTPLDPEDLISSLTQIMRQIMEAKEQYLPIKVSGIWGRLNTAHILYLESAGHSLIFHMDDGREFRTIAGFRDYQALIGLNRHFLRCHKSYVVNLSHVTALEQNCFTLKNGDTVNISRPYRQLTRSFYACYITDRYDQDQVTAVDTRPGTASSPPLPKEGRNP